MAVPKQSSLAVRSSNIISAGTRNQWLQRTFGAMRKYVTSCRYQLLAVRNEHTLYGFREFLGAGAVDIAQPDIGSCGGISAARHIMALAQSHGVQINPHVWGSAIAQAASLQVIAAVPVAHHSLFGQEPILEYDRSSHPFRQQLVRESIQQFEGWVDVPSKPGLGVEVDREILDQYRVN